MEKKNKVVEIFVSFDGKEYKTENECLEHERQVTEYEQHLRFIEDMTKAMNITSVRNNKHIYNFFSHENIVFDAHKFVYNSYFPIEEYLIFLGCTNEKRINVIIDGVYTNIPIKNIPTLIDGETYLVVCTKEYEELIENWHLYNLKEYKKDCINTINDI